jgi:hypothetical protein
MDTEISYWKPPMYDDAFDYCVQMCRARSEKVPLGVLQGQRVSAVMTGMVECHGDDTMDLHGTGQLVIKEGSGATTLDIQVLGSILGTSTALLIDATGRIWIYNTPHAVDLPLPNLPTLPP